MRASSDGIRTTVRWVSHYGFTDSTVERVFQGPKPRRQPTKKLRTSIGEQSRRCDEPCRLRGLAQRQTVMQECERNDVGRTLVSESLLEPCHVISK